MAANNKSLACGRGPSIDRTPGCTHITLTRIFTTSDGEVCDLCHQPPMLGWLYRCTQDSEGFLPASDFHDDGTVSRFESDAQLYTLSNSVLAAAQKGHYTDEELSLLWKQKSRVRESIRQAQPYPSSSASSTAGSSRRSLTASSTFSTIQSLDSETDSDLDFSQLSDQAFSCRTVLEPIHEVNDETIGQAYKSHRLPYASLAQSRTAICHHRVCHRCRPSYKDRVFPSIDQIMLSGKLPPMYEWRNKRLSLTNLLVQLDYTRSSKGSGLAEPLVHKEWQRPEPKVEQESRKPLHQVNAYHNLAALGRDPSAQ